MIERRVEWEEKRAWKPSDGQTREDFPNGIWEKHTGIMFHIVDRLEIYRATGLTNYHMRACIVLDDGTFTDKPLAEVRQLEPPCPAA